MEISKHVNIGLNGLSKDANVILWNQVLDIQILLTISSIPNTTICAARLSAADWYFIGSESSSTMATEQNQHLSTDHAHK